MYQRGVRHFLVPAPVDITAIPDATIIVCEDPLVALQMLAAEHRLRFDIPVIGITGSNGKTIVKEWLNLVLEDRFHIVRSPRSYNSQIGVPLSVWQMNATHELGIFEAGISTAGEMMRLQPVIRPTLGIITNIGLAHEQGFSGAEHKAHEKLGLFCEAETLIYPSDDQVLAAVMPAWSADFPHVGLISFGRNGDFLQVLNETRQDTGSELLLKYQSQTFTLVTTFSDAASVQNLLSCVTVLLLLKTPVESLQEKISRPRAVPMRMEQKNGINQCTLINDSYSADLSSLAMALDFLRRQVLHPKKTVILSDIPESGRSPESLYRETADLLKKYGVNRLIGIGTHLTQFQQLFSEAVDECSFFPHTEAFLEQFSPAQFRNETILIKGARVFGFEQIDRLLALQAHETQLEVNLETMAENLRQYQQLLRPSTKIMAMVKAFSYGSGGYEIARVLEFHKVDYLAVAYADEGVNLRRNGIRMPVMVMNTEDQALETMVDHQLEPVLFSLRTLQSLEKLLRREGITHFPVHVELETGMHRLGFTPQDFPALPEAIASGSFHVQSVFSHLAASEETQQDEYTRQQFALFKKLSGQIADRLAYPFLRHLSNSSAIARHPELQLDMVRLGIGLYGVDPTHDRRLQLKPVGTLKTTIAQIQQLQPGETVGYNRRGLIETPVTMATVRLGYADGYPRTLGNGAGKMWYRGREVPTIGSICMDMTMLDISGIVNPAEGDEVIVFGADLPVETVARWAGTIPYEMLTGLSSRVKRVYFE